MVNLYEKVGVPPEAVKHGFSWPAFFFGPFWAFYKGM